MDPESTDPRGLAARSRSGRTRWGVRKRATASAVIVVAGALLVAGSILLMLLQTYLSASTETASRRKADDVIAQMDGDDVEEAAEYIMTTAHAGQYVQILAPNGTVFASSDSAGAARPVTALRPSAGEVLTQKASGLPDLHDNDDFLVVAKGVAVDRETYTVAVASTVQ